MSDPLALESLVTTFWQLREALGDLPLEASGPTTLPESELPLVTRPPLSYELLRDLVTGYRLGFLQWPEGDRLEARLLYSPAFTASWHLFQDHAFDIETRHVDGRIVPYPLHYLSTAKAMAPNPSSCALFFTGRAQLAAYYPVANAPLRSALLLTGGMLVPR